TNHNEWFGFLRTGKRPSDIPANPSVTYGSEWSGWGDWLGTGNIANGKKTFLPFEDARRFARSLGLKSFVEWHAFARSARRPPNVPFAPHIVYRATFRGMADWLGFRPKRRWSTRATRGETSQ